MKGTEDNFEFLMTIKMVKTQGVDYEEEIG
jgi:hypothetical protein